VSAPKHYGALRAGDIVTVVVSMGSLAPRGSRHRALAVRPVRRGPGGDLAASDETHLVTLSVGGGELRLFYPSQVQRPCELEQAEQAYRNHLALKEQMRRGW
jgi:hypothetical protein